MTVGTDRLQTLLDELPENFFSGNGRSGKCFEIKPSIAEMRERCIVGLGDVVMYLMCGGGSRGLSARGRVLRILKATWSKKCVVIMPLESNIWSRFTPFFDYPAAIRKVAYTTNTVESVNCSLHRITKDKSPFPNDEAFSNYYSWVCTKRRKSRNLQYATGSSHSTSSSYTTGIDSPLKPNTSYTVKPDRLEKMFVKSRTRHLNYICNMDAINMLNMIHIQRKIMWRYARFIMFVGIILFQAMVFSWVIHNSEILESLKMIPICSILYMIYLPFFFGRIFWAGKQELMLYNFYSSNKTNYYIIFAKNIIMILITILLFCLFWMIDLFISFIGLTEFLIKPVPLFIFYLPCCLLTGNIFTTSIMLYRTPILAMILQTIILINIVFFYLWFGTKIGEMLLALVVIGFGIVIWLLFSIPIASLKFQKNKTAILEVL